MSFGLSNVPASFWGYIYKILAKKLDIFVIVYLNNIFIYTKNPSQSYVNVIWWILKKLRKNSLFTNFKKCQFYKDKVCFLGYILLVQIVQIKNNKIDIVKNWPKSKSMQNI